jgi:uncharacterized membrane protein
MRRIRESFNTTYGGDGTPWSVSDSAPFFVPNTFVTTRDIEINDGGTITTLSSEPIQDDARYTLAQQLLIDRYNQLLINKNLPVLTKDESDYVLNLHPNQQPRRTTTAELQILAGCKVDDIIAKARGEMKDMVNPIRDLLTDYFNECSDTEANLARSELSNVVSRIIEETREYKK